MFEKGYSAFLGRSVDLKTFLRECNQQTKYQLDSLLRNNNHREKYLLTTSIINTLKPHYNTIKECVIMRLQCTTNYNIRL